jgi:hypothetical protein
MVLLGSRGSNAASAWPGEAARAAVPALEPSAVPAVAQASCQPSHQGCASPSPVT